MNGAVYVVTTPSAPTILASTLQFGSNQFQATFTALPGIEYVVEASEDLQHWGLVQIIQATTPVMSFSDTETNMPQRFYRVRVQ